MKLPTGRTPCSVSLILASEGPLGSFRRRVSATSSRRIATSHSPATHRRSTRQRTSIKARNGVTVHDRSHGAPGNGELPAACLSLCRTLTAASASATDGDGVVDVSAIDDYSLLFWRLTRHHTCSPSSRPTPRPPLSHSLVIITPSRHPASRRIFGPWRQRPRHSVR
jgi:hypothetical protein